jgi:opacity protein-like surface antigen
MKLAALLTVLFCSFYTNLTYASCCQTQEPDFCYEEVKTQGPYIGLIGGLNFFDINHTNAKFDPGYYLGSAIGYKFSNSVRLEAEASYQRSEIKSARSNTSAKKLRDLCGHMRSWSYMVNLLLDFDLNLPFIPYFGAGLGYSKNNGNWSGHSTSFFTHINTKVISKRHGCAWQGIIGIKYLICEKLEVGIDYRYFLCEKDVTNHKIGLALIRYF